MALQRATSQGGDFLDLKALTANGPVLAVFHIREFLAPSQGDYGTKYDVAADVLICSGPQEGEIHTDESFMGAVTNTLRGVKRDVPSPVTTVGAEIAVRLERSSKKNQESTVFGNVPSDPEMAVIEQVYTTAGGEGLWAAALATPLRESVTTGNGATSSKRPW